MRNPVLLVVLLTGCVHYMPAAVSSTSVGSQYEKPVKFVTGTSSAYYILGLGPLGDDSLAAAVEDAKSQAKADSISNVFVDRVLRCFPICGMSLITRVDTMISGTLVKYSDEQGKPLIVWEPAPAPATAMPTSQAKEPVGNATLLDTKADIAATLKQTARGTRVKVKIKDKLPFEGSFRFIDMHTTGGPSIGIRPSGGSAFSQREYFLSEIEAVEVYEFPTEKIEKQVLHP